MGRRYSKFLTVILIIIIVAVIGLLSYLGYSYYTNYHINKDASEAVDAATKEVVIDGPVINNEIATNTSSTDNITTNSIGTINDAQVETNSDKKRKLYKGFYMLGSIEIPKTGIKYPILEKVTKKSLETSVAIVYPENAELNKPGNIVIVGHNYRNGMFFSNNKRLSKGDRIYITDLDGNRLTYSIYNIFETTDTDTSFYNRDTNGKKEITLSTCTDDSARRLIIEARAE